MCVKCYRQLYTVHRTGRRTQIYCACFFFGFSKWIIIDLTILIYKYLRIVSILINDKILIQFFRTLSVRFVYLQLIGIPSKNMKQIILNKAKVSVVKSTPEEIVTKKIIARADRDIDVCYFEHILLQASYFVYKVLFSPCLLHFIVLVNRVPSDRQIYVQCHEYLAQG